jgi:hypothetical protein
MTDSAPREAAQADAKQTDAKQARAKASPGKASTAKPEAEEPEAKTAGAGQAEAGQAEAGQAEAQRTATADGDGKPDMDEVKRKFREALDRKREIQAEGSGAGGRNTGKIHGAHGPEDHRRTFRRKSG